MAPPKWCFDAPEIPFGSELIYNAFWDLHTCRNSGWGAMRIPWMAMRDYFTAFKWDEDDFVEFTTLIRMMDDEYMAYSQEVSNK